MIIDIDMEEYFADYRYTASMAAADLREASKQYVKEISEELKAAADFENGEKITDEVIQCAKSILDIADKFRAELQDTLDCINLERVMCLRKENADLRAKIQEETQ